MGAGIVVWALPGEWDAYELDNPGAEAAFLARIRRQWEGFALDPSAEQVLLEGPRAAMRAARAAGTLTWAVRAQGNGTPQAPLSIVTVNIGLAVLPTADGPAASEAAPNSPQSNGSPGQDMREEARALVIDETVTAFVRERRLPVELVSDRDDITMYEAQAFVTPRAGGPTATVSAATLDPAREDEARTVAGFVARSIRFVSMEDT